MQKVKVNKLNLLKVIQENRDKHIKDFELARSNYPSKLSEYITSYCKEQVENASKGKPMTYPTLLQVPASHAEDYDTTIEMLQFSNEIEVEITNEEFKQFVQDKWNWKQQFDAVTSFYNNK